MPTPPDTSTRVPPPDHPPEPGGDLALRAVLASARRREDPRRGERALLHATQDLTLCSFAAWERLRNQGTTAEDLFAQLQQARFLLREAQERAQTLAARLEKLHPRRRPHYTPPLRFRILEHMKKYLLSVEETSRRFGVTPQTIYNWMAELRQRPEATTVGAIVLPVPPVQRFCDGVRRLVRQMHADGFGGKEKIAQVLLRNQWKISPRTVGRILREKPAAPGPQAPLPTRAPVTTVRGDHPNHLWLQDITEIPTLFPFFPLHLMVVLDACSRLPLAATLSLLKPSAAFAARLLERAIATHGKPRHLVVDRGCQFTAEKYQASVKASRIQIRHGAVGQVHSLGLIDRFFRTLKDSLSLRTLRPWSLRAFRRRLDLALLHYAYVRPHDSLEGMTPIEVYYGIRGHLPTPVSPPRGWPADPEPEVPFDFVLLDPENRAFPALLPTAA